VWGEFVCQFPYLLFENRRKIQDVDERLLVCYLSTTITGKIRRTKKRCAVNSSLSIPHPPIRCTLSGILGRVNWGWVGSVWGLFISTGGGCGQGLVCSSPCCLEWFQFTSLWLLRFYFNSMN
jgi:hypothetical protein